GRALQPKTVKGYLSAVRSLHVDEMFPFDACKSKTVRRVIHDIKRFHGERDRSPKQPITLDILQKLASVAGDLSDTFNASRPPSTRRSRQPSQGFSVAANLRLDEPRDLTPHPTSPADIRPIPEGGIHLACKSTRRRVHLPSLCTAEAVLALPQAS
ncbi:hypothetical protein C0995_011232, partial [Termitomyces sp. Mi166